jgi:hypothetical protein
MGVERIMADYETSHDVLMRRISEQEARVQKQELLVAYMAAKGLFTKTAEELLGLMRDSLGTLRASLNHHHNSN